MFRKLLVTLSIIILVFLLVSMKLASRQISPIAKPTVRPEILYKPESDLDKKGWKNYTNNEGHFSIFYPPHWKIVFTKPNYFGEQYEKQVNFVGKEGEVHVGWTNDGYGGGCPDGYDKMLIGSEEKIICHTLLGDKEFFSQLSNRVSLSDDQGIITYSSATINQPIDTNRNLVLNVFTSIRFLK